MENLEKFLDKVERFVKNPSKGLPDEIFYFVGRMTPYINVDLLIKHPQKGILLTWRNDKFSGSGWHFPGGIIRFRESIKERIINVGKNELDIKIKKISGPLDINQIIRKNETERSHFISLLYECKISFKNNSKFLNYIKKNQNISFFKKKPKNLLKLHKIYKKYFDNYE